MGVKESPKLKKLIKVAKQAALDDINKRREAAGMPKLKRLEKLWWDIHGKEYLPLWLLDLGRTKS